MKNKISGALGVTTLILMLASLFMVFKWVPTEEDQGIVQRIFYFHVPLATAGYVSAALMFIGSLMYLIKRDL